MAQANPLHYPAPALPDLGALRAKAAAQLREYQQAEARFAAAEVALAAARTHYSEVRYAYDRAIEQDLQRQAKRDAP